MSYIVHRVWPSLLEAYLNGAPTAKSRVVGPEYSDEFEPDQVRPKGARLVGIYQEDFGQWGIVNDKSTHEEYRVVWEL